MPTRWNCTDLNGNLCSNPVSAVQVRPPKEHHPAPITPAFMRGVGAGTVGGIHSQTELEGDEAWIAVLLDMEKRANTTGAIKEEQASKQPRTDTQRTCFPCPDGFGCEGGPQCMFNLIHRSRKTSSDDGGPPFLQPYRFFDKSFFCICIDGGSD